MNKFTYPIVFTVAALLFGCGNTVSDTTDSGVSTDRRSASSAVKVTPAADGEPPLSAAEAMLDKGRVLFKRCSACHTLNEGGRHRVGPNLWNIAEASAGRKEGFNYSAAMRESGLVWTDDNLAAYLENPRKFMPKNKMSFAGLRNAEDQKAVITYLKDKTTP